MSRRGLAVLAVMAALAAPATASAYATGGRAWPGRPAVITYSNATAYKSQVRVAAAAWNTSGAGVRFVETSSRRAKVHIRYDGFGAVGYASIGRQPGTFVSLGRRAGGSVLVAVIAHELGHILGLDHETRRCATMNPIVWSGCSTPPPCTVLQADDVRGAIRRYGGRARSRPSTFCPAPPSRPAVTAIPDGYGVQATFRLPSSPYVTGYGYAAAKGACPKKPGGFLGEPGKPGAKVTVDVTPTGDPFAGAAGDYCLALWSTGDFNRVGRTAVTQRFTYAPQRIASPASLTAAQGPDGVLLRWTAVTHRDLRVYRISWRPGDVCDTTPAAVSATSGVASADGDTTSTRVQVSGRGRFCFAIWSEDRDGNASAKPATVLVDVAGHQPPYASFEASSDGTATVAFTDSSEDQDGRIVAWRWDFGDGTTSTERNPSHTYAALGEHQVTLTVTDDDGLTGEVTFPTFTG